MRYLCALVVLLLAVTAGCNTSLYHQNHDQQLPGIRTVAIVPLSVEMAARHTGNTLERRIDVEEKVTPVLLRNIEQLVTKRGLQAVVAPVAVSQPAEPAASFSLPATVNGVIDELYYANKISPPFDYAVGNNFQLPDGSEPDAVLLVRMHGVFPTGGRIGLKVTAIVVGGYLGSKMVKMSETHLSMMLVNAKTGEVLWYNQGESGSNARDDDNVKSIVKKVGEHLLKPRKS